VRQGFAQLSEPAKLFQTLVADSLFNYQASDKCFEWNVSNAVQTTDKNENIKVHKALDKPHDKVDSVIALITGLNPESLKEPKKKNPYRKRGMIIL
jgi:phage terminase large subunit-like protein